MKPDRDSCKLLAWSRSYGLCRKKTVLIVSLHLVIYQHGFFADVQLHAQLFGFKNVGLIILTPREIS